MRSAASGAAATASAVPLPRRLAAHVAAVRGTNNNTWPSLLVSQIRAWGGEAAHLVQKAAHLVQSSFEAEKRPQLQGFVALPIGTYFAALSMVTKSPRGEAHIIISSSALL